jgi:RNA polymerase sigma-70 factor, ECF subfamily
MFGVFMGDALSIAFRSGLPRGAQLAVPEGELEGVLERLLAEGQKAWPRLTVEPTAFAAFVAEKVAEGPLEHEALAQLRAADLYLACACTAGDGKALQALEDRYFGEVEAALTKVKDGLAMADDIRQILRERLFLALEGSRPRIAYYSGRGDLRNWLRVTVARTVLNQVTRGRKEVPVEEELLNALPPPTEDPELEHFKRQYRADFEAVFPLAIEALTSRERTLLRQRFADGLTVPQLCQLYGVHPATMARWLAKARSTMLARVRKLMMQKLNVDMSEFSSLVRMVQSQLDITMRRFLKTGDGEQ